MTSAVGQIGYIAAFGGYVGLALTYALWGRWGRQGRAFLFATLLTAAWAGTALAVPWPLRPPYLVDLLRSEAHTSELQSLMRISYAVFCLENKRARIRRRQTHHNEQRCKPGTHQQDRKNTRHKD